MKNNISFYLLICFFFSCATTQNSSMKGYYSKEPDLSKIIYEVGDGTSMEKAIVIKFAENERNGIASEYAYVEKKYGKKIIDWKLLNQSSDSKNDKKFDVLTIQILQSSQVLSISFDITEFFGKL